MKELLSLIPMNEITMAIVIVLNVATFFLFSADKKFARERMPRIPEWALLAACAVFGAVGGLCGMIFCRHKTRKPKFLIAVPLLAAAQVWLFTLMAVN